MTKKRLFVLGLILLGLFIFFLPKLLSFSWGTRLLTTLLPGKMHIESLSLSWLGPQHVKQFCYQKDALSITCERIDLSSSLFSLLKPKEIECFDMKIPWIQDCDVENSTICINAMQTRVSTVHVTSTHIHVDGTNLGPSKAQGTFLLDMTIDGQKLLLDAHLESFPVDCIRPFILIPSWLGSTLTLQCQASLANQEGSGTLSLQTESLHTELAMTLQNGSITLSHPIDIRMQAPIPLVLHLDTLSIPKDYEHIALQGDLSFLQNHRLTFACHDLSHELHLNYQGPLLTGSGMLCYQKPHTWVFSRLQILKDQQNIFTSKHVEISQEQDKWTLNGTISDGFLLTLLGDTLTLTIENGKHDTVSYLTKTPLLSLDGTCRHASSYEINSAFTYILTPESYALYRTPFRLLNPTLIEGSIKDCVIEQGKLSSLKKGLFAIKKTLLQHQTTYPLILESFEVSLSQQQTNTPIIFSSNLLSDVGSMKAQGAFTSHHLHLLECTMQHLSSALLDALLLRKDNLFTTLFGAECSLQGSFHDTGPASLTFSAPQGSLSCHGYIKDDTFFLQEPLHASLQITESSSHLLTGSSTWSTERPITLTIPKENVMIPLHNILYTYIPQASIDLGKIRCQGSDALFMLLKTLKAPHKKPLELWFAPIDLHLQKGELEIERSEILVANTYELAYWGKIDCIRYFANLTLGITAQALEKGLLITNLPKDYVLKLPLQGPLDHIELNTTTATSKIAALLLWQSGVIEKHLGPFGQILKQAVPPPGGEGPTPPAKTPFPWQKKSRP